MRILRPYLIGQITKNILTYEWRAELEMMVQEFPDNLRHCIDLINPCGNEFSKKMLKEATDKKLNFSDNVIRNLQSKLFPAIDKGYVKEDSNCAIFNANNYSPEAPFIGTIFELAWYHDQPWKPVIGVFEGDYTSDYLCTHPFVQDTVHAWVDTPQNALNLLVSLHRV